MNEGQKYNCFVIPSISITRVGGKTYQRELSKVMHVEYPRGEHYNVRTNLEWYHYE